MSESDLLSDIQSNVEGDSMELNSLSRRVISCAVEVHKVLGPGLLESVYEECLCFELQKSGLSFERQREVPIRYKDIRMSVGYRMDIVVERAIIPELKSVDRLDPIHEAQLLTYLRLAQKPLGLLLNFNSLRLKDGIRRFIRTEYMGDHIIADEASKT